MEAEPPNDVVWKFGFGSNLAPSYLKAKKSVQVHEWAPCTLQGWALCFNLVAQRKIEPAYANIVPSENDTVHGSVCKLSKACGENLDRQERTYQIKIVEVTTYEGRKIQAEVYVGRETAAPCYIFPSKRYLNVIISGAIEVGLKEEYLLMLKSLPYFRPTAADLQKRLELPVPSALPKMTIDELAQYDGSNGKEPLSSVCGYICDSKTAWRLNYGRDTTFRKLLHFRGISIDVNDDKGRGRPFPVLLDLDEEEREYCFQALDEILGRGKVVAFLQEFLEDQGTKTGFFVSKPNL